jgi:hypothetical protein
MAKTESVTPCYRVGDTVTVREAYPIGHVRTPYYIRGKTGVIERFCGAYPNPEELAYARSGLPRQPLYRVRFRQTEIWPDYDGQSEDTIDVEIYQHWLKEPSARV